MAYGNWTSVKAAILTAISDITVTNGYNYDWVHRNRTDIYQNVDIYVSIDTPEGEENTDEGNSVGVNEYNNQREVEFYIYLADDTLNRDLDNIVESVEDKLELALDDFKLRFNNDNDDTLCASGLYYMQYVGMEWVTAEDGESKADVYAPIKMKVLYEVRYRQQRT